MFNLNTNFPQQEQLGSLSATKQKQHIPPDDSGSCPPTSVWQGSRGLGTKYSGPNKLNGGKSKSTHDKSKSLTAKVNSLTAKANSLTTKANRSRQKANQLFLPSGEHQFSLAGLCLSYSLPKNRHAVVNVQYNIDRDQKKAVSTIFIRRKNWD